MIKKTNFIDNMFKLNKKINSNPINNIIGNKNISFKKQPITPIKLQTQWKQMSVPQRNVNRILYKDTDRDGVPDKWDCQPRNPMKQDTQIYLGKKKNIPNTTFYTYDYTQGYKNNVQRIYVGEKLKNIDVDTPKKTQIKHISNILAHETLHNEINKIAGPEASLQLDNITQKSVVGTYKGKQYILNNPKYPAKIIGSKEKQIEDVKKTEKEWLE